MKDTKKRIVAAIVFITLLLNVASIEYFAVYEAKRWNRVGQTNQIEIYSSTLKGSELIEIFQTFDYYGVEEFKFSYKDPDTYDANDQNNVTTVNSSDEYSIEFGSKDNIEIYVASIDDWASNYITLYFKKSYTIETEPTDQRQPATVNELSNKNIGEFDTESEFDVALKSMITASWSNSEDSGSVDPQSINVSLALTNKTKNEFGETVKYYSVTVTVSEGQNWLATEQATVFEDVYWTVNQYSISFNTDGGTAISPIKQDYGTNITPPTTPTKYGYTFVGWDRELPATMPAENIVITAKWAVATKNVSFDPNDGVWPDGTTGIKTEKLDLDYNLDEYIAPKRRGYDFLGWEKQDTAVQGADESYEAIWNIGKTVTFKDGDIAFAYNYAVGETITPPTLVEKVGYSFAGWDLVGQNGVGDGMADAVTTMGNESVTYVAIWTPNMYTVTFYRIDDELYESVTKFYGESYSITSEPTLMGHTFVGWDLKVDGKYDNEPDDVSWIIGAENLEYREIIKINQYTITFDTEGGSPIEPITLNYGASVTPPKHPIKIGCEFDGWDINIPQTMPAKDYTITARWTTNNYTITFDTDGGTTIAPITQKYGDAVTFPDPPTKAYHTFAGWDKEIPTTMPAENITIKALWNENNYTITFDTDGGSEIDSITQAYGTEIAKPNNPEKEGYVFVGWDKEIPSTMPAENITITAIWNEAIKVVSFDPNGGVWADNTNEIKTEKLEFDYNAEKYIAPTKRGYDFGGWIKKDVAVSGADESYEAIWNLGKTVSFKDGDAVYEDNYAVGETVTAPALGEKIGHTFVGWDLVEENGVGDGSKDAVISIMGNESITYVAIWEKNKYTVTFYHENGDVYEAHTKYYGESFSISNEPSKTGYTFIGWDLIVDDICDKEPDTVSWIMGAQNLEYKEIFKINQYTITFNTSGGSEIAPITQNFDSEITLPSHPTKIGCEFVGWNMDIPTKMPAKDITITAIWNANSYTITFDTDGGSYIAPIVQKYGEAVSIPNEPSKIGHTFAGWDLIIADGKGDGEKDEIVDTMGDSNISYVALWSVNSYKINWTVDGQDYVKTDVVYGESIVVPATPVKMGYTFGGWNVPDTMPAEDITLNAVWIINQYTISFITNGDTEIPAITKNYGETIVIPEDPIKTGYTFAGWDVEIPATMPAENITISAQWTINSYKVIWNPNGGIWSDGTTGSKTVSYKYGEEIQIPDELTKAGFNLVWNEIDATMGATDVEYVAKWSEGDTVTFNDGVNTVTKPYAVGETIDQPENPSKIGHRFIGWDANGDNKKDNVIKTMGEESIVYVALWEKMQYTVTFYCENGDVYEAHTKYYGEAFSITNEPSKLGYTFVGWDLKVNGKYDNEPDTVTWVMGTENLEYREIFRINQYTITFDTVGGSIIEPITLNYGTTITPPAHPTKVGCEFDGWDIIIPQTMPAKDYTITARWTTNNYTITFDTDGGTTIAPITQKYGDAVTFPDPPTKAYHTFAGWDKEIPTTMPAENITIKALWNENNYTITFDTDGGSEIDSITQAYGTEITKPINPEKEGYLFVGWDKEIPSTMPAENISITAKWEEATKRVSFDPNGGKWNDGSTLMKTEVLKISDDTHSYPAPTKKGYNFGGWQKQESAIPSSDESYVANWIPGKTVVFKDGDIVYEDNYAFCETVTAPVLAEKVGYTFVGWDLVGLNGVGDGFKDQVISVMGNESLVYVAIWQANEYTVYFYDENDELIEAITAKYGAPFGISIIPTKTGHTFVGWDLKKDGKYDGIVDAVSATMGAENLEYREIFRINRYTITFDTNGGSTIEPITLNYGEKVTPPVHPTKVGYEFDGWDINIPQTMPAKDSTITALWKSNSYKIMFDTDGGSEIAPIVFKYGEAVSVSSVPSRIGYIFAGWDKEIPETMPAEDLMLTAKWTINQYTITFDTDGGSMIDPITRNYGEAIKVPNDPTKSYYTFAGWDKEIPATMPAENITIKASWNVNNYTITFDTDGGSEIDSITQAYGTEIAKPNNPEKEGYVFVGWDKEIPSTMPAENITITAIWNEAIKVVSFDPNGGVWADNTNEIKTEKLELDYNAEKYIAPTKRGYDFDGWIKKDVAVSGADESYEAIWNLGKTVTFKDGDTVYEDNYAFGETVTAPVLAEKVGYTFVGWDLVGLNGVGNGFKDQVVSVMGNESLVYVAIWQANEYTVYFYNENDELIEAITAKYGAPFGISITPTKTGHTFVGWDLKKDGKYDSIADAVSPTMGAEDLEYREIFAIGQYTITFDSDGGSAVAPITQSYGTDIVVPADPTKEGYKFAGWDKGVPLTMPALNITLTARWEKAKYSISWDMNADGVIDDYDIVTTVEHGDIPVLPEAEVPVKESTAEFSYVFTNSWLPAIKPAEGDATYTAQYDIVLRKYTVKFLNYDGTSLQTSEVEYGATPVYCGETPIKIDDKQYDYTFAGWSPTVESVTKDAVYTATFTESIKKYTVVWKNWDGSVLETDHAVEHGDFPKYNGKTPTKPATEAVNYVFEGWEPQISGLTGDVTYTATFTEKVKTYSITWLAEDGSIIDVTVVEYGKIPAYAAPMKPSTAEYSYAFAGWNPSPVAVSGDATYTASYTATKNKYTVTWNVDGTKTSESYEYGVLPTFKGSSDKAADGCTAYSFTGWNKKVSEVVGNVEYIATYSTATVHISTEFVYESNHNNTHSKKYECCKSVVETVACADAMNDGNHKCDFCGADSIGTHIGGKASCKTLAKCDECGSTYGSYDANNHESNQIRYSDITKTTHDEIYACCNAIKADNAAHNYVDKNCTCGAKKIVTVVIMNGESVWETIESEDDAEVSVSDMPVPTPTPGYVFSGWYTEDGVRVDSETDLTDDMVLHAGYFSGDVDGDGTIEKDDVGKLTRYIVGQDVETVEDEKAFDINGDGDVTVVDSILLLLHISGKRPMTP